MKVVVIKENLTKAVSLARQVVSQKPTLPILNNLLLSAKGGVLKITATDLETTLEYKIPVKVESPGDTTVPAKTFIDFCQSTNDPSLRLICEKDNLLVKTSKALATLPTINPTEFPTGVAFSPGTSLEIAKLTFAKAAASTAFCAAPKEGRPVLTGILFASKDSSLHLVATDGYRLARKEVKVKSELNCAVPSQAVLGAARALLEQEDEEIEILVNEEKNLMRFQTGDLTITTRLLEGDYPDYEQIIPRSFLTEATVSTKELLDSVKVASLFAREVGNVVRLDISKDKIKISGRTTQVGEAEISLGAKTQGEDLRIAFNSRFLLECLAALEDEKTHLSFSGLTSAALLRGLEDESLLYVVMPVRIQS